MRYLVRIDGLGHHQVEVDISSWFGGPRLLLNGERVESSRPNQYLLRRVDGTTIAVELRRKFFDPLPTVIIDDQAKALAPPFSATQWFLIGLPSLVIPFSLLFGGLLIGLLVAAAGIFINARLFRADMNVFARYGMVFGVFINAVAAYFVLAYLISVFLVPPA